MSHHDTTGAGVEASAGRVKGGQLDRLMDPAHDPDIVRGFLLPCLAAAAFVALAGGCTSPAPAAPHNVVLVTIDTLRADRIGRGVAPALDALAASSVRFTNARTTVPLTLPAHTSILTGTSPLVHGVHENGVVVPGGLPTLATVLGEAGYRTAAFVGAYVLDGRFGLARGFDVYDDRVPRDPRAEGRLDAERRASEVVDAALAWLDGAGTSRFFLWVHLYDPHAPYDPPAGTWPAGASAYDGEVAYASAQVARLLDRLTARGLTDSTVVAVAGDHGEGLGEHGEQTHGMLAYDATLRVPLFIFAPGQPSRDEDAPVSLADLAPSILRLARVEGALSPHASPRDLFAPEGARDVYAETEYPRVAGWHPLAVLAYAQWKLVLSSEPELYDVQADPGETRNLATSRRQLVQTMSARLKAMRAAAPAPVVRTMAPDAAARLRALGYVGGSGSGAVEAAAPNPAGTIASWTAFEDALTRVNRGAGASALPALQALSAEFPTGGVFQSTYARALQESGRAGEAVAVLGAAVDRRPDDPTLFHDLAVAARLAGDDREALRAEQAALALDEQNPSVLNGIGLLHADAGRAAEAADAFERATRADPSSASAWSNLGNARQALGDRSGAESAYRRALAAQPQHADAANGLGVVLVQQQKAAEAVPWLERVVAAEPDFHEARLNLGIAQQQSGAREQAIATYRDLLAKAPRSAVRERAAATALLAELR